LTPPSAPSRLPYPGLRSFRREESDLFFGREDCINTMVDRLAATRFLGVLGSSGTGKSSVVKTGLLDALDLGLMAPAGSTWRVIDMRPGGAPLTNLAQKLLESARPEGSSPVGEGDAALLRAFLLRGPRSIVEWCADGHLPEHTNLLLLVDQFEELFRYQDYAGREEAEAFAALLIESARQTRFPIYVALTMRSEYLGACALIDGLAEAISAGMFLIPRMTREQCRAAIVGPATVCGFKIEDALANRMLNDLAAFAPWDDRSSRDQLDRLGRRADQLPLLQYCLNRMWSSANVGAAGAAVTLTVADYERIGGLSGALDGHANEILSSLGAGRRPIAERVFRALTDGATVTEAVRRPTRFGELVEICDGDEAAVRAVADAFRAPGCNFLAPELDPNHTKPLEAGTIVDISHESLIRQWKQLSEWLEKEARAARQWRRLLDRFEDRQPLPDFELDNLRLWQVEERPNAAWARRYRGDYSAIMEFAVGSERWARRFAPATLPLFGFLWYFTGLIFVVGIEALVFGSTTAVIPPLGWHAINSTAVAATCAFGLWRYDRFSLRRAMVAAVTIFAATFLLVGVAFWISFASGLSVLFTSILAVILPPPIVVACLAVFEPRIRKTFIWVPLVFTFPTIVIFLGLLSTNQNVKNVLAFVAWCIWCSVFGFQLRQLGLQRNPRHRRAIEALKVGLLAPATFIIVALFIGIVVLAHVETAEPWNSLLGWVVNSAAATIPIAYGQWRLRAIPLTEVMRAEIAAFLLTFGFGAALILYLLSHDFSSAESIHLVAAISFWTFPLIGFSIFDRVFAHMWPWLLSLGLFLFPYGTLLLLYHKGYLHMSNDQLNFCIGLIATIWFTAIGYWMQCPVAYRTEKPKPAAA
jgi:hypothetical protein